MTPGDLLFVFVFLPQNIPLSHHSGGRRQWSAVKSVCLRFKRGVYLEKNIVYQRLHKTWSPNFFIGTGSFKKIRRNNGRGEPLQWKYPSARLGAAEKKRRSHSPRELFRPVIQICKSIYKRRRDPDSGTLLGSGISICPESVFIAYNNNRSDIQIFSSGDTDRAVQCRQTDLCNNRRRTYRRPASRIRLYKGPCHHILRDTECHVL